MPRSSSRKKLTKRPCEENRVYLVDDSKCEPVYLDGLSSPESESENSEYFSTYESESEFDTTTNEKQSK